MRDFFKYFIYGSFIGVANIIPGLSGGTVAVILNIYDTLLEAISNLKKEFKNSIKLLIPLAFGAGIAIILSSKIIIYLLHNYPMIVNFFFVGVIIGSIPMIYHRSAIGEIKLFHWVGFIISFSLMILIMFFAQAEPTSTSAVSINTVTFIQLFFAGVVAAISMLIPGISGSFMLLLIGSYDLIITAIKDLNIILLLPVAVGVSIGIFFGSKLISTLIKRFPNVTYLTILGFVIGSIPVLLQKVYVENNFSGGTTLIISLLILIIGASTTFLFDRIKK